MNARLEDWGLTDYREAWERQLALARDIYENDAPDVLVFVEHPKVLTLGASHQAENLLFSEEKYRELGIQVEKTDRGGDVTYHGPNQLVAYPVFNVARHGKDLHKWMRDLEEALILTLNEFGLTGRRFPPHTGVWVDDEKVAAIGVKIKKWVSTHGIALNCNNDLMPFQQIVPCGIRGYGVTSLSQLLDRQVAVDEVKPVLIAAFARVFGLTFDRTG
jgi:lipoyl(octanoyl) transferase